MKQMGQRIFCSFIRKPRQQSGLVAIIVLWVLVILTILVLGLARKTNVELTLTKHALSKSKAKYIAWAGVLSAIDLIRRDSKDTKSSQQDTLYYCGRPVDDHASPQTLFEGEQFAKGSFEISYPQMIDETGEPKIVLGFQDEERRININTLEMNNINVLIELLTLLEVDSNNAYTIAYSLLDWKDADKQVNNDTYGAEDEFYQSLEQGYKTKNLPFDSLAELKLVRGITDEIYQKIEKYLTVYPKTGRFRINYDTADKAVISAVARAFSGAVTNTEITDADALVEKILTYRKGADGIEASEDDQVVESGGMPLNAKESVIWLAMNQYRTRRSDFFKVLVKGKEHDRQAQSTIEAVIDRTGYAIVGWHLH